MLSSHQTQEVVNAETQPDDFFNSFYSRAKKLIALDQDQLLDNMLANLDKKAIETLLFNFIEIPAFNKLNIKLLDISVDGKLLLFFRAVRFNNEEMAARLIDYANLSETDSDGSSILWCVNTLPILNLILQKAQQQNSLKSLLSMRNIRGRTVFEAMAQDDELIILQRLLSFENWHHCVNLSEFLDDVRLASWRDSGHFKEWDEICQKIKKFKVTPVTKALHLENDSKRESIASCHKGLFGKKCDLTQPKNQADAINYVLAQVQSLLTDPRCCLKYLRFLNTEFNRYLDTQGYLLPSTDVKEQVRNNAYNFLQDHCTHGSAHRSQEQIRLEESCKSYFAPVPNSYTFKAIHDLCYPIPNEHFKGQTKHNALDKFLITLFKQHGLKAHSYQWVGFIPHDIADNMVINDYVKENRYGVALLHGTVSHALQQAILMYAIEGGDIDTGYEEGGMKKNVSLPELQKSFVSLNEYNTEHNLWIPIRDRRFMASLSFTDPHRLSSMMMQHGEALGLASLSHYMIDSFCKSFNKWLAAHCEEIRHTEPDDFIAQLNDIQIHNFPVPAVMIRHAIWEHENKHRFIYKGQMSDSQNYGVVTRDYELSQRKFTVKTYHPDDDTYLPHGLTQSIYQIRAWLQNTGRNFSDVFDTGYFLSDDLKTMKSSNSRDKNYEIFCNYIVNCLKHSSFSSSFAQDCPLLILFSILRIPHWLDSTFSGLHDNNDLDIFIKLFCATMGMNNDVLNAYDNKESINYNIFHYYLSQTHNKIVSKSQPILLDYINTHPVSFAWSDDGLILTTSDEETESIALQRLKYKSLMSILALIETNDEKRHLLFGDCIKKLTQDSTVEEIQEYLLKAFCDRDTILVRHLLSYGANANQLCLDLRSPFIPLLSYRILQDDPALLIQFITQPSMNVNMRDHIGRTALYLSADGNCNLKFIRYLLENGADCNLGRHDHKGNPLIIAINYGKTELLDLLLEYKVDLHQIFFASIWVITHHLIQDSDTQKFVNYLKVKMATDHLPEELPLTSLQFAIICGRTDMVKKLLNNGCNLSTTENNLDVSELAAIFGNNDIKDALIQHKQNQTDIKKAVQCDLLLFKNQGNLLENTVENQVKQEMHKCRVD